jgi:hypothetical protein
MMGSFPTVLIALTLLRAVAPTAAFYPLNAVRALHAELTALQQPSSCADARVLALVYSAEDAVNGFGAMFQFAAGALAVARALNRTLVEALPARGGARGDADPWVRAPAAACGGLKLGCFLEPLSPCALEGGDVHTLPEVARTLVGARAQAGVRALRLSSLGRAHALLHAATRGDGPGVAEWWSGAVGAAGCVYEGARADAGACARRLWFPAIEAWAFRPLPRVTRGVEDAAVRAMRARVAAGERVWGLHVRLGDAVALGWRSAAPLSEYVAAARLGRGRPHGGAREALFLATDSAESRAAAAQLPDFAVLASPARILQSATGGDAHAHVESFLRDAAAAEGGASGVDSAAARAPAPPWGEPVPAPSAVSVAEYLSAHHRAALLGAEPASSEAAAAAAAALPPSAASALGLTEGVISDIWALAHSTHFVGTCLSQVSRTAYDLSYAAGRARAAPVGLDVPACRARGHHFMAIAADWRSTFDAWTDDGRAEEDEAMEAAAAEEAAAEAAAEVHVHGPLRLPLSHT